MVIEPVIQGNCINSCRYCGRRTLVNSIGYCNECSKPRHPGLTKGFRFTHGIWNYEHSTTSGDIARPEVHPTRQLAEKSLKFWMHIYVSSGCIIWWHKIDKIDVRTCFACGRLAEKNDTCLYCGSKHIIFDNKYKEDLNDKSFK